MRSFRLKFVSALVGSLCVATASSAQGARQTYYLCSGTCQKAFEKMPYQHVAKE